MDKGCTIYSFCRGWIHEGAKILPHSFGIQAKCGTDNYAIHYKYGDGTGQNYSEGGGTSSYIDNIFVNKSTCTAACVRDYLLQFGLTCKDPERLRDGTHVLGLSIMEKHGKLQSYHRGELPLLPDVLTCRRIFSQCGKLTSSSVWLAPHHNHIHEVACKLCDSRLG